MVYRLYSYQCPFLNFKVPYNWESSSIRNGHKFVLFAEHTKQIDQVNNYGIPYYFQNNKHESIDAIIEKHLIPISYDEGIKQIRALCRFINKQKGVGAIDSTFEIENSFKKFFEKN